jgi:acyl dehydratase
MEATPFKNLEVGDNLPALTFAPITRQTLALYAGASGDHNPIHIDSDFARQAGMEDVFAHGMLSMAYLGRALTSWVPQIAIRQFSTRFVAITHLRDQLTCRGTAVEEIEYAGERCVRVQLSATDQNGEIKLQGEALVLRSYLM